ncbi:MAG: NAD(P)-dependent oxidoreductase [Planctomycetota bacterium]
MSPQPLVIQTEHLDDAAGDWLRQRAELVRCASNEERFAELLPTADALVVRTYTRIDEALLDAAPALRVVGRAGIGLDSIDVAACRARGVEVVYTPDSNSLAVVELVIAFALDGTRDRLFLDRALPIEEWKSLRADLRARRQLCEMTLGILGMGRVGSKLARAGAGLFAEVIYHDMKEIAAEDRHGASTVGEDELLSRADVLSIHVDARPSNRHWLDRRRLNLVKDDVVIVNTSRGFVVDDAALASFLSQAPGACAMLDVHEPEPIAPDHPLLGLANGHLSPHIGAATRLAHERMSWVVRDVWRVLNGERPEWPAPEPL